MLSLKSNILLVLQKNIENSTVTLDFVNIIWYKVSIYEI